MNTQPQQNMRLTPEEYLEYERNSQIKHEYFDGEIFVMVGAKRNHNIINANITTNLVNQFRTDDSACRVFSNDMRIKIEKNGKYTYPDVAVACDRIEFEDNEFDILLNPIVIIEILSPSTESYDRGKKFEHYQLIESLKEYILIAQDHCLVEKYVRSNGFSGEWKYTVFNNTQQIMRIESIKCTLPLSDIYNWVEF
ncbi:MAG: Uma2 family endonuclease [Desulfamplus sp.]|nr:Uma2 family endonuclease [Desulfamplus sp.]